MTGTTSEFGGELDSLADVVSFGVAPALLAYSWGFSTAAARGVAGRVPLRGLRHPAPGPVQRAEELGGRTLFRRPADSGRRRPGRRPRQRLADARGREGPCRALARAPDRALVPDGEHVPLHVLQEGRPEEPAQLRHGGGHRAPVRRGHACTPSGASSPWPRCSGSRDRSPISGDSCSAGAPARLPVVAPSEAP